MNLNAVLRIDPVESIGDELARRVMQLRRKLGTGRARSDDRDLQLLWAQDVGLRMAVGYRHSPAGGGSAWLGVACQALPHVRAYRGCRNRCSRCPLPQRAYRNENCA